MKTKNLLFLLTLMLLLLASSCSGSKAAVRTDVPVTELATAIEEHLAADTLALMNEGYIKGAMKMKIDLFADYLVKVNAAGANIDEYGIFKAKDPAQLEAAEEEVKSYLQLRRDTWMEEYMPEEKPKLEAAEVKTVGLYVIYAIVSEESRKAVFDTFTDMLTIKE